MPTGGIAAIAIIDAGDYPTAASDLEAFDNQFGIPAADLTVVYANGTKPPVYQDWEVEEALDIEWAHAMAPKAKLYLVESILCTAGTCTTDPTGKRSPWPVNWWPKWRWRNQHELGRP